MERVDYKLAEEVSKDFEKRLPAVLAQRKSRNQNVRKLLRDVAAKYSIVMTTAREDKFLEHLARLHKFSGKAKLPVSSTLRSNYGYVFHSLEVRMSPEEKVARAFIRNE